MRLYEPDHVGKSNLSVVATDAFLSLGKGRLRGISPRKSVLVAPVRRTEQGRSVYRDNIRPEIAALSAFVQTPRNGAAKVYFVDGLKSTMFSRRDDRPPHWSSSTW